MKNKVWYVTGASKGLGLALVKELLKQNYQVAATSRNVKELEKAVGVKSDNFLPLALNLTDEVEVEKSIAEVVAKFGAVDVVVNNAGFGLIGGLEELTDAEARGNFEVNVFGALNVIRKALPQMRKQSGGHILNVASIGGFTGSYPAFGIYCATKFAVHGFSESLAEEVRSFGIHVTIVSPGYFRTNFLDSSLAVPAHPIAEYKAVREMQAVHQSSYNGNQPGDPDKAAKAMIEITNHNAPPLHLFLGKDAYQTAAKKIEAVQKDLEAVRELATSTDF
jgi:NAD(P)-dependent dehydrogenase (short-subunit alcohol dehydrogenase family)